MFALDEINKAGELLLVTDELPSPADFLLHRLLAGHLKGVKGAENQSFCLYISISGDLTRMKHVAAKSNVNLHQHLDNGSLRFVDALTHVQPGATLRPLFDLAHAELQSRTEGGERSMLVVLDGISPLEWLGFSSEEISRLLRALCSLCRKMQAALVIRHHILTPGDVDDTLRQLLQLASYHLEVLPLASGRSGVVSGEIALHAAASCSRPFSVKTVARNAAMQYRLTDAGATFFDKGTSIGVL